jgi:hypothetical protein
MSDFLIALSDLVSSQTTDEVVQTLVDILVAAGIPADQWRKAGSLSSLMRAGAMNFAAKTVERANNVSSNFLDFAAALKDPTWLRARAKYDFDVDFIPATFATGKLSFDNTGSGIYGPFAPGAVTAKMAGSIPSENRYYTNTETFSLNPGDEIDVAFTAAAIGSSSTAAPGEIDELVTPLDGVTVTNALAFIGTDDELSADLLERTKESLGALSPNGPGDATKYIAKTPKYAATTGTITRVSTFTDKTTGYVTTYVATAAGPASDADVEIVRQAIEKWATANCRTNIVAPPTPLSVPITYTVWVKNTAATEVQIKAAIAAQLVAYFSQVDIGGVIIPPATTGELDLDTLKGEIFAATPGVVKVSVTAPIADLVVANNELPTLGLITGTVVKL